MRKASIAWLISGIFLGAATVIVTVGVRQSHSGLSAGETQTLAEVQALLGDPAADGGSDWQTGTPMPLPTPTPSLSPELARDLAAIQNQQHVPALEPMVERIHAPRIVLSDETHVSISSREPPRHPLLASSVHGFDPLPYTGSHSTKLEKLGKILLPEGVCQQLKSPGVLFVTAGPDGCLELYPPIALDRDAAGRKISDEEARRQRRLWFSRMTALRVEANEGGAHQVGLPPVLVQAADLDGYLVIIGVGDHFEIWDAQRWQDYVDGKPLPAVANPVEPACYYGDAPF